MTLAPVPYWRLSGFYFWYFAALGTFVPYWGLYLQAQGFSAEDIGVVLALAAATRIIASNLCSWLADRSGHSIRVIRDFNMLAVSIFAGVLWAENFRELVLATLSFNFFWNSTLAPFEAVTLRHLQRHQQTQRYSLIRIWGSLGFIICSLGGGYWLDYQSAQSLPYLLWLFMLLLWGTGETVPDVAVQVAKQDSTDLWQVIRKPEVIICLTVFFLIQLSHGPYYSFFSIYLHDYGYDARSTGWFWSLGVLAEIVLFMFMRRFQARYSLRAILLSGCLLAGVRWWLIAYWVYSLPLLIVAQSLHAASFGAVHIAAVNLIQRYFQGGLESRGQALYSSLSYGLGGMLGSLFSGYCWDSMGSAHVFVGAALACLLASVLVWQGLRY